MKKTIITSALTVFLFRCLGAMDIHQCDTLVTQSGRVLMVHSPYITDDHIRYVLCDDTSQVFQSMPLDKVARLGARPIDKWCFTEPVDPLTDMSYRIRKLTGIGTILFCTGFFMPFGIILLLIGTHKSDQLLRKLKQNPDHPDAERLNKFARKSILRSTLLLFLPVLFYVLIALLL